MLSNLPGAAAPVFALAVLVCAAVAVVILARLQRGGSAQFRAKAALLTENERLFYAVLVGVLGPQAVAFPQVRMGDFIEVQRRRDGRAPGLFRITNRSVDFVICRRSTMAVLACIEVDDKSHRRGDRRARDLDVDGILKACGIPLVRVPAVSNRRGYSAADLASLLAFLQTPDTTGG